MLVNEDLLLNSSYTEGTLQISAARLLVKLITTRQLNECVLSLLESGSESQWTGYMSPSKSDQFPRILSLVNKRTKDRTQKEAQGQFYQSVKGETESRKTLHLNSYLEEGDGEKKEKKRHVVLFRQA